MGVLEAIDLVTGIRPLWVGKSGFWIIQVGFEGLGKYHLLPLGGLLESGEHIMFGHKRGGGHKKFFLPTRGTEDSHKNFLICVLSVY